MVQVMSVITCLKTSNMPIENVTDIVGGFPCQDASSLNNKQRRNTIQEGSCRTGAVFRSIIDYAVKRGAELQSIVLENVAGLLHRPNGCNADGTLPFNNFEWAIFFLEQAGFFVAPFLLKFHAEIPPAAADADDEDAGDLFYGHFDAGAGDPGIIDGIVVAAERPWYSIQREIVGWGGWVFGRWFGCVWVFDSERNCGLRVGGCLVGGLAVCGVLDSARNCGLGWVGVWSVVWQCVCV